LWQDANYFCQKPRKNESQDYYFSSRRFTPNVKILRGGKVVVQIVVGTTMIDGCSFADYYADGDVGALASLIAAKQADKVNRQNQAVKVKVLRTFSSDGSTTKTIVPLDIEGIDLIFNHAELSSEKQKSLADTGVFCRQFAKEPEIIPFSELYLVVDAQITQEDHGETIIDPGERYELVKTVRNFIDGSEVFNQELQLSRLPIDTAGYNEIRILPPDLKVKDEQGVKILKAPTTLNVNQLKERIKNRVRHVRKNGFLEERPINPLLAYPAYLGKSGAEVMTSELNSILDDQGIKYRFKHFLYNNGEQLRTEIENGGNDAVLVVLPNERDNRYGGTYKFVKQNIQIPSQCIQSSNIIPRKSSGVSLIDLRKQNPKLAGRIRQRFEICIWNLLVKHHWIPFIPANSFNYNVQLGLDVGGTHNTHALSCLGYGFRKLRWFNLTAHQTLCKMRVWENTI